MQSIILLLKENKSIVLVTPGQPSVNPRIVKEADALSAAGHQVTVLYSFWIDWAQKADKNIVENAVWKHQIIGGNPERDKLRFWISKIKFRIYRTLNSIFGNVIGLAENC